MLIWSLRIWFLLVFVWQTALVTWAMLNESLFQIPPVVSSDVWFIATVSDAYLAIIAFGLWVCARERTWVSRIVWFLLIVGLGNVTMALYMLILLFGLPTTATAKDIIWPTEEAWRKTNVAG